MCPRAETTNTETARFELLISRQGSFCGALTRRALGCDSQVSLQVSDAVLDACLAQDPFAKVRACRLQRSALAGLSKQPVC